MAGFVDGHPGALSCVLYGKQIRPGQAVLGASLNEKMSQRDGPVRQPIGAAVPVRFDKWMRATALKVPEASVVQDGMDAGCGDIRVLLMVPGHIEVQIRPAIFPQPMLHEMHQGFDATIASIRIMRCVPCSVEQASFREFMDQGKIRKREDVAGHWDNAMGRSVIVIKIFFSPLKRIQKNLRFGALPTVEGIYP
jgi:hypothetical protein